MLGLPLSFHVHTTPPLRAVAHCQPTPSPLPAHSQPTPSPLPAHFHKPFPPFVSNSVLTIAIVIGVIGDNISSSVSEVNNSNERVQESGHTVVLNWGRRYSYFYFYFYLYWGR